MLTIFFTARRRSTVHHDSVNWRFAPALFMGMESKTPEGSGLGCRRARGRYVNVGRYAFVLVVKPLTKLIAIAPPLPVELGGEQGRGAGDQSPANRATLCSCRTLCDCRYAIMARYEIGGAMRLCSMWLSVFGFGSLWSFGRYAVVIIMSNPGNGVACHAARRARKESEARSALSASLRERVDLRVLPLWPDSICLRSMTRAR